MPYDDLGLSDACFDAVNTIVSSCPAWVARYTGVEYVSHMVLGGIIGFGFADTYQRFEL
jgi:hypothetical protein